MKVFRKGRSAVGGRKPVKARPSFQRQVPQCAVSFSIGSSGGGTSLWLEFEPATRALREDPTDEELNELIRAEQSRLCGMGQSER